MRPQFVDHTADRGGAAHEHASGRRHDLVLVDAPASGHAISFLRAPRVLLDLAGAGPIHHQAREASAMLRDPARAQVALVTIPEETPVTETIETAYALEEDVGVALAPSQLKVMVLSP